MWSHLLASLLSFIAILAQNHTNRSHKKEYDRPLQTLPVRKSSDTSLITTLHNLHLHKLVPSRSASVSQFFSLARNRRHGNKEHQAPSTLVADLLNVFDEVGAFRNLQSSPTSFNETNEQCKTAILVFTTFRLCTTQEKSIMQARLENLTPLRLAHYLKNVSFT